MSIRDAIVSQLQQVAESSKKSLPPLSDELPLLELGLDSLGIAVLVTRLEDELGLDPFTDSDISSPPVTLGEFIRLYENAAKPV
jgi:acyl carrier protein